MGTGQNLGRLVSGVRRRVHGNDMILYRVEAERVLILHIVHGARDYGRLLDGEG
jgi:plasmid stabilization system protein ParE